MKDLKDTYSAKEWRKCCGKGCRSCVIAQAYVAEHGRKKGLTCLKQDKATVRRATKKVKDAASKNAKKGSKPKNAGKKSKKKER